MSDRAHHARRMIDMHHLGLQGMRNQFCWGAHYMNWTNLSLSFGKPHLQVIEPYESGASSEQIQRSAEHRSLGVKGKWWLWVQFVYWKMVTKYASATASSSERKKTSAFSYLRGQRLKTLVVDPRTGATSLAFDLGGTLTLRRMFHDHVHEMWFLYKRDESVLTIWSDATFEIEPLGESACPVTDGRTPLIQLCDHRLRDLLCRPE